MSSKKGDFFSNLLENFGKEVSKIGSDVTEMLTPSPSELGTKVPAINIIETGDAFEVYIAAPGLKKENFKVGLDEPEEGEGKILMVGAKIVRSEEEENQKYLVQEFQYETFKRAFEVPETVDDTGIKAAYTDGILKITLPKVEDARTKPAKNIEIW